VTFAPIREGRSSEERSSDAELDEVVHEVVRKHLHGIHLNDATREVRQSYPSDGFLLYWTGAIEREWVHASLCRLAIRGYIYRIGRERYPYYEYLSGPGTQRLDMRYNPLAMDEDINFPARPYPLWKPIGLLEVLAKAAAGSEPYATEYKGPKPSRLMRFLCRLRRLFPTRATV